MFNRADVETAEAIHAAVLPYGMAVGACYVLGRADPLAQAAGSADACVAEELVVERLPRRFPLLMNPAAGRSE